MPFLVAADAAVGSDEESGEDERESEAADMRAP